MVKSKNNRAIYELKYYHGRTKNTITIYYNKVSLKHTRRFMYLPMSVLIGGYENFNLNNDIRVKPTKNSCIKTLYGE